MGRAARGSWKSAVEWVKRLDAGAVVRIEIAGESIAVDGRLRAQLAEQRDSLVREMERSPAALNAPYWLSFASPEFLAAFIRCGRGAVRLGEYYEELVVPADTRTLQLMRPGGKAAEVKLLCGGGRSCTVGGISRLMSAAFAHELKAGTVDGLLPRMPAESGKLFMSVKLNMPAGWDTGRMERLRDEALLKLAMEKGLDFRPFSFEPLLFRGESAGPGVLPWTPGKLGRRLVLELLAGVRTDDAAEAAYRFSRVIEGLGEGSWSDTVRRGVSKESVVAWVYETAERRDRFAVGAQALDAALGEEEFLNNLAERTMKLRDAAYGGAASSSLAGELPLLAYTAYIAAQTLSPGEPGVK